MDVFKILSNDVNEEDDILRNVSSPISDGEFKNGEVLNLYNLLKEVIIQNPGVGLALPQLGINKRMFMINVPFEMVENKKIKENVIPMDCRVYVNTTFKPLSNKEGYLLEGCLSISNVCGIVGRYSNIEVTALDENGNKFTEELNDYNARIFLHEYDHLEGILFIDKSSAIFGKSIINEKFAKARLENDKDFLNSFGYDK